MPLDVGTSLNHYSITGKLGEGGMGTVYSAKDTKLGRHVAVKVLPPELAEDDERLHRFEREARTIASLNHPNVVTLYSVETSGETRFLTMELVDGTPLSERISDGGMPVDDFFRVALPLVEAVAAAHAKGITHRDLKPTNIMIDRDFRVKVLDFGLAKLAEGTGAISGSGSPLATNVVTGSGQIIGTVAYMSPEQAEGRPVDARSDVFSLGVVLYEMLTACSPFSGETPVSVLSAILREEPAPVTQRRGELPRQFQRIVARCLAKDPARRYQTVLGLRNALDALRDEVHEAPEEAIEHPNRAGDVARAAALLLAGATVGGAAATALMPRSPTVPGAALGAGTEWSHSPLVTSMEGSPGGPVFSPDGLWILYTDEVAGQPDLWRMPATGGRAEQLTDTPGRESDPVYSPDGDQIAFALDGGPSSGIHLMPAEGGNSLSILEQGSRPAWSPDGGRIAFVRRGAVWTASEASGWRDEARLTRFLGEELDPAWSGDGQAVLVWDEIAADVMRFPLDRARLAEPMNLVPTGEVVVSLATSADGRGLVLAKGQYGGHANLWYVPLDQDSGGVASQPRRLSGPITDDRDVAVSRDGSKIVFLARKLERHLYQLDLDEATGLPLATEPRRLTHRAPQNYYPELSQDGNHLVWTAHSLAGFIFRMDLRVGTEEKLNNIWDREVREIGGSFSPDAESVIFSTTEGGVYRLAEACRECVNIPLTSPERPDADYFPSVSPDGQRIAFDSNRFGNENIWIVSRSPGSEPVQLTDLSGVEHYAAWFANGESILFRKFEETDLDADIYAVDLDGSNLRVVLPRPGDQTWAAFAPDGSRLYFASDESGTYQIWMRDAAGEFHRVTSLDDSAGSLPRVGLYTKFAVGSDKLIVPVETISGEIWVMERPGQ